MSAIPTILSVTCPWCDAKPGAICVHPSGKVFRDIHKDRWDAFSFRRNLGTSRFVVEITTDDPEFTLRAGEHYTASVYWLDPAAKVTLYDRDGEPLCNQYAHAAQFLHWGTVDEPMKM